MVFLMVFPSKTGSLPCEEITLNQLWGVQMELDGSNESYLGDQILMLSFMVDA